MIRVGTSGYSYKDWVGPFYPQGTSPQRYLEFYSRHFDACEINFTYYRNPDARTLAGMVDKSGGRVEFVLKANQEMTHTREAGENQFRAFREALQPLRESGTFGGILVQFPYNFHPSAQSLDHLRMIGERFDGLAPVVEFRNHEWVSEETFAFLREHRMGFCCVDEPRLNGLMPPVALATSEIGYVRFHGRNAKQWWQHERPEQRYDYLYAEGELREWLPRIREIDSSAAKTFVFMNNHFQGKAVKNALTLLELLSANAKEGTS